MSNLHNCKLTVHTLHVSYTTLIAVETPDTLYITNKHFSKTTSAHIRSLIEEHAFGKRIVELSQEQLENMVKVETWV